MTVPVDDDSVLGRLHAFGPAEIGTATELFAGDTWPARVAHALRWSRSAVELSALTAAEFESALAYLKSSRPPVRRLSVHAPLALPEGGEDEIAFGFAAMGPRVAFVVQHPDVLTQPARLARLGSSLALENMDKRKSDGRLVRELGPYFRDLPHARFCLDVAHAKSVDPTLEVGHALLDAFGPRLCEVHVSGIDGSGNHIALSHDDIDTYESILRRCCHVPWILESLPADAFALSGSPPNAESKMGPCPLM
jgi:hypothetical protein